MSQYLTDLRNRIRLRRVGTKQGWGENGFSAGGFLHQHDGLSVEIPGPKGFDVIGNQRAWSAATAAIEDIRERLTILMAFAAPLMPFTKYGGIVVMPYGNLNLKPITRWMMSVWGNPDKIILASGEDRLSLHKAYDRHNNLPILMDGGGEDSIAELARMSNEFSRGRGKVLSKFNTMDELTSDPKEWSSIFMITSRDGITDRLVKSVNANRDFSPIFDYMIESDRDWRSAEDRFMKNYGSAGLVYGKWLSTRTGWITEHIEFCEDHVWKQCRGVSMAYKPMAGMVGCLMLAAAVTKTLGLVEFDPRPAVDYACLRIREIHKTLYGRHQNKREAQRKKRIRQSRRKLPA